MKFNVPGWKLAYLAFEHFASTADRVPCQETGYITMLPHDLAAH